MSTRPADEPAARRPPAAPETFLCPAELFRDRKDLWLETAAVLALGVLPPLYAAFADLAWPQKRPEVFIPFALALTVRTLWQSGPVLYLIWRSRERWSVFGLRRPWWVGDLLLGGVIWATAHCLCYAVVYQYSYLLSVLNGMVPTPDVAFTQAPRGAAEYVLLVLACCAIGFNEELLMRGYLIPRCEQLLGSTWKGLLLTTVFFALLHVYQGLYGVVFTAVLGLVYGVAFCWLRRLWPVAIAHALADFVALAGS